MTTGVDPRELEALERDLCSADEEVRRLAVERLLPIGPDAALPVLTDRLGDTSWRVRKAAVDILSEAPEDWPVATWLVGALADGENPGRRNAAVEALVRSGRRMVEPLVEATHGLDVDVRKFAVDALAGIGSERATPRLVEMLADDDPNVRGAVADALGVIGGEAATRALVTVALRDDEDSLVRFSALRGLARLEAPMRASELGSALSDPVLRPAAYGVLGRTDDREGEAELCKGLEADARSTREAAMEALLRAVGRAAPEETEDLVSRIRSACAASERLVTDAVERLDHTELSSRLLLVQFLGLARVDAAVVPLLRAAHDEALAEVSLETLATFGDAAEDALDREWDQIDLETRRLGCEMLSRTGGVRGAARLAAALEDVDPELRTAAADAVGRRGDATALPLLVRCLHAITCDGEPEADEEREAVTRALISIAEAGATETISLLADSFDSAPEPVRLAVARVLAAVGGGEQHSLLLLLMQDPSAAVRREAVSALAHARPDDVMAAVRIAVADESREVRIAVAVTLGDSSEEAALEDLERLLSDDEVRVRAAALCSIGEVAKRCGGPCLARALPLLRSALDDDTPAALAAVAAFEHLGGGVSLEDVRRLVAHEAPEVVQAVIRCLRTHGTDADFADLVPLARHAHWAVRADAIEALAQRRVVSAVPAVLRRLDMEQDEFVRDVILRALSRLEG